VDKQTNVKQQTNSVADAEYRLAEIEQTIARHAERGVELAAARKRASYGAHALHDVEQRKQLAAVVGETVRYETEGRALIDARDEGRRRLEEARQHAAREADKANARQVRKVIDELVEHGAVVDDALHDLVEAGSNLKECFDRLSRLGVTSPRYEQLATLGNICVVSALGRSIWKRYHRTLAPGQRMTFADLTKTWAVTVERDVRARLGEAEQTKTTEAA
jgi:hypothetical protein